MEENLRQLLLKDLCARLPYGVIVRQGSYEGKLMSFNKNTISFNSSCAIPVPYLRPMSSMTEEEYKEFSQIEFNAAQKFLYEDAVRIDWLNTHHFDYRGLIKQGLAIEVTKENNPYKE